jgi:two-component system sensor histidine kinase KdpD
LDNENNVKHFLDLIQKSRKGKFKVYIGMSAGVGNFRMLQEAHTLLKNGIDVKMGLETHNGKKHELLEGLPVIPKRTSFIRNCFEEMDLQAIINLRQVVIVDELAHTNIEGNKNENVGRMF